MLYCIVLKDVPETQSEPAPVWTLSLKVHTRTPRVSRCHTKTKTVPNSSLRNLRQLTLACASPSPVDVGQRPTTFRQLATGGWRAVWLTVHPRGSQAAGKKSSVQGNTPSAAGQTRLLFFFFVVSLPLSLCCGPKPFAPLTLLPRGGATGALVQGSCEGEGDKTSSCSSLSQTRHSPILQPRFPASRPRSLRVYVNRQDPQSPTEAATLQGVSNRVGASLYIYDVWRLQRIHFLYLT